MKSRQDSFYSCIMKPRAAQWSGIHILPPNQVWCVTPFCFEGLKVFVCEGIHSKWQHLEVQLLVAEDVIDVLI